MLLVFVLRFVRALLCVSRCSFLGAFLSGLLASGASVLCADCSGSAV